MFKKSLVLSAVIAGACLGVTAAPSWAVVPGHWENNSEASFDAGTTKNTIITNLGDVKLSSASKVLDTLGKDTTVLYDMQKVNGQLYLAAGPKAAVLLRTGDKLSTVATLKNEQIFALGTYKGQLLVAISGSPSKLAVLADGKLKDIAVLKDVRYIWDTLTVGNTIFVATGTSGKILSVQPGVKPLAQKSSASKDKADKNKDSSQEKNSSAKPQKAKDSKDKSKTESATKAEKPAKPLPVARITTVLKTKQKNIMCLGRDQQGRLYAGTDTNGLVYRLTKDGDKYDSYVLYQASEPEIDTLLVLPDGTVYAGTSNAKQARPGRIQKPQKKDTGKPSAVSNSPEKVKGKNKQDSKTAPHSADSGAKKVESAKPGKVAQSKNGAVKLKTKVKKAAIKVKKPTAADYDRLRQVVKQRLAKARQTGELAAGPMPGSGPQSGHASQSGPSRVAPVSHHTSPKQGNVIYKIDTQGFVSEVFRESVMILNIVKKGDNLIVTTGNEGQVYQVNPSTGETAILAKLKPEQISAVSLTSNGNLLLGTANPASLIELSSGNTAGKGTYTSKPLDAKQISLWGQFNLTASIDEGTTISLQTRSGNVDNPKDGGWSKWSKAYDFKYSGQQSWMLPRHATVQSPPARFLQYRLTLKGEDNNGPVVHGVNLAYVTPNLAPQVSSITGQYPEHNSAGNPPSTKMQIKWKASDPNKDSLLYTLDYRRAGSDKWINIKKNLDKTQYDWQTQQIPDGYYQLRITASDKPDNPPAMALTDGRTSSPVLVDNTAPVFKKLTHKIDGATLIVSGVAVDDYSNIASIGYVIDSGKNYTAVLPDDLIFDSTQEPWHVKITNLSSGPHVVTLRVTDSRGNTSYQSLPFTIEK